MYMSFIDIHRSSRDLQYEGAQVYRLHELSVTGQTFLSFSPP